MRRIRLLLEYDGTGFCGYQRQPGQRTVQGALEEQLSSMCGHAVNTAAAGRTDTGVHATGQVVHFDTMGRIPTDRLELALNTALAPEVRVRRVETAPADFHARFSAASRTYHYWLSRERPSPFLGRYVAFEDRLLPDGAERMQASLPALLGRHDFVTFCADSVAETTVRTLLGAEMEQRGGVLKLELTADAFLRGMVRSIMGLLLEIGRGRREPDALAEALAAAGRKYAAAPAPAHGLFLARVEYPDGFGAGETGWFPPGW